MERSQYLSNSGSRAAGRFLSCLVPSWLRAQIWLQQNFNSKFPLLPPLCRFNLIFLEQLVPLSIRTLDTLTMHHRYLEYEPIFNNLHLGEYLRLYYIESMHIPSSLLSSLYPLRLHPRRLSTYLWELCDLSSSHHWLLLTHDNKNRYMFDSSIQVFYPSLITTCANLQGQGLYTHPDSYIL